MNIAVCDDEKQIRKQIQKMVQERIPGCAVKTYGRGEDLLGDRFSYDILFLDIQMEGLSGIETAREIRRRNSDVILIFITAIREYVFEAFDVSAFHYLLKPVSEEQFGSVIDRAAREVEKRRETHTQKIFIQTRNRNVALQVKEICYIESQRRKVEIHTTKEIIEFYATMNELEEQLGEGFYRCHRSYLVNMAYIFEYGTDYIRICNGDTIYMAKDKYHHFVKAYMHYLRKGGVSCV